MSEYPREAIKAVLRAAVLKVLAERVLAAKKDAGDEAKDSMRVGDRLNPELDGVRIASVTKAKGRSTTTVRVTDEAALTAWVAQHYPDKIVRSVDRSLRETILYSSKSAGEPCGPGGELDVPGLEVEHREGEPTLSVRLTDEAEAAVEAMWAVGGLGLDGTVRELSGGAS